MANEIFASQSLIPIQEIKKGVIILKDGALRSVIEVSAINFALKSTEEQALILESWARLLNDLDFSLEVLTRSYKVNIDPYLSFLKDRIVQEENELLKLQGEDYLSFLTALVKENSIMKKSFYIIVPYNPTIIKSSTIKNTIGGAFKNIFRTQRGGVSGIILSSEEFERYYQQLMIRNSLVISALTRMGLSARPLETKEIITLFYDLYNPQNTSKTELTLPENQTI